MPAHFLALNILAIGRVNRDNRCQLFYSHHTFFFSFFHLGLSNNQVMEHVKAGHTLTIPSGIKPQLETLLKTCWNMTATKRPTASEIVELLSNNPRLISPCIDVPLASVQVERTDSLELIPSVS